MIIIDYQKKNRRAIIRVCVDALKLGKAVAYPTDTSYGLAVDTANIKAIKRLYRIKGRDFHKPVHVVVPSVAYAKKIVKWNSAASRFAKKFWPGALTLVLVLSAKCLVLRRLSAGTGYLGIRMPKNKIALDLVKHLKRPITATSANRSGRKDCYSADDIISGFKLSKFKPDIIINAGKLPKRKPSTIVKVDGRRLSILRQGLIRISPPALAFEKESRWRAGIKNLPARHDFVLAKSGR